MDDVKRLTALAVAIGVVFRGVSLPRGEFEGRWLTARGRASPDDVKRSKRAIGVVLQDASPLEGSLRGDGSRCDGGPGVMT